VKEKLALDGNVAMLLNGKVLYIRNLSVSLSSTLSKNEKVEHHLRIKAHKSIVLRF